MSLMNGVVIGLVTDVNDNGKVKIKFPWLPEEPESDWVRIATTMAGNDRGTFFMPEKDDEVLVAFEHGDTEYPVVVGFLWNGKDKPPENDKHIRRIKTTSGHTMEFDDNPGQEKIVIETQGKHTIEFDDKPGQEKIKVESQGGQKIEIEDNPAGKITIKTQMGNEVKFDDVTGGSITVTALKDISLNAPTIALNAPVSLSLSSANISLQALGSLSVTAPTIQATGITTITGATTLAGGATINGATNINGLTNITGPTTIIGTSPIPVLAGGKLIIA